MNRMCVIDVPGLSRRVLSMDSSLWLCNQPSGLRTLVPTFPAVPASVMASLTTGVDPGVHGVVAGGVYCRQRRRLSLQEHSNTLLTKKRFWQSLHLPDPMKVAMLFWANPLAGGAQVALGDFTYAPGEVPELPPDLHRQLVQQVGPSQLELLHGPHASWTVSEWIAAAAWRVWQHHAPDLMLVRLPGVDFELERHGLGSPNVLAALRELDRIARHLAMSVQGDGGQSVVLSDGAYTTVQRSAAPNLLLRRAGLLTVRQTPGGEEVDMDNSRAFAMIDHQVAHIYCDEAVAREAADIVARDTAVAGVFSRDEMFAPGMGHDRAGERVVLAAPDAWLDYRWWEVTQPPRQIASKCGYDPCELLDAWPRNVDAIQASLGLVQGIEDSDRPILAASFELPQQRYLATDLPELLRSRIFQAQPAHV